LRDPAPLPATLPPHAALFGAAFLPPLLLEFFLALATRLPLRFYQPNPCLDYWGDIVSGRERARRQGLWNAHRRREGLEYAEAGHPLLASWGALGREYLRAIHAPDSVVHDDDAFVLPDSSHLLGWLQKGILLLDPRHETPPREHLPSIELHGCPDRRREVEVLHDRLLAMFEQRPELKPHDIVVMSPQIDAYVPYIDAVFGGAARELALPYRISDVPLRRAHPLVDAFLRVLALDDSRFTRTDVAGLLAEPAIARRFGIDADGLAWIATWLEQAAVRWGLDAPFRAAVGSAPLDENSWRFGFDRLLLGHALGDASALVAGVAPVTNVEGGDARVLGELARFVDLLAQTRAGHAVPRTATAWRDWLGACLEALFDTEPADGAELAAMRAVQAAIRAFGAGAERWLDGERLPFEVVRVALEEALAEPTSTRAGRFGITFCGMVPMRNVPHRVVCVLGLDAGAYPRRQPVAGFNLMRRHPRPGDRSVREDDRFLFLEALVAARDVFYLSHVERDAKGAAKNPPSPLVQELLDFLAESHREAWPEVEARLRFTHRLHPFDPGNYAAGSALRSHDAAWWAAARASLEPWREPVAFAAGAEAVVSASVPDAGVIELDDLLGWLRDPVADWFRRTLPVRIDVDAGVDDSEPFGADRLERFKAIERLLGAPEHRPDRHRLEREGSFPLGPVGESTWDEFAASAARIEALTVAVLGGEVRRIDAPRREIAIAGSPWRLAGTPRLLVEGGRRALLLRRAGAIRGVDLARLALERTLLAGDAAQMPAFAIGLDGQDAAVFTLGPLQDQDAWLRAIIDAHVSGLRWPVPLYPRAASAYARTLVGRGQTSPLAAARAEWLGNEHHRGEAEAPLNALFTRDAADPVGDDAFVERATAVYLPLYAVLAKVAS
ncbi:MAG: exodeoxyribonuclease V subunit gamma, partial [Xanthomonadales bacterium]|nr:exodeoxyribonuclease V subunit gamma [Xanthomonadales bacterium]